MSCGIQSVGILRVIYTGETYHSPIQLRGEAIWKDRILKFLHLQIYNMGFHSGHARWELLLCNCRGLTSLT